MQWGGHKKVDSDIQFISGIDTISGYQLVSYSAILGVQQDLLPGNCIQECSLNTRFTVAWHVFRLQSPLPTACNIHGSKIPWIYQLVFLMKSTVSYSFFLLDVLKSRYVHLHRNWYLDLCNVSSSSKTSALSVLLQQFDPKSALC